jgi:hypothetical protein
MGSFFCLSTMVAMSVLHSPSVTPQEGTRS